MSFYVTLPSNGSRSTYPNNTSSVYTNQLARRLEFHESDWEVALASISVPDSHVFVDVEKLGTNLLEQRFSVGDLSHSVKRVKSDELLKGRAITNGISLFSKLVSILDAKSGLRTNQTQWHFRWDQRGDDRVLLLDPSELNNDFIKDNNNYLAFGLTFAENFNLVREVDAQSKTDAELTAMENNEHTYSNSGGEKHYYELGLSVNLEKRGGTLHSDVPNKNNNNKWWKIQYNPKNLAEPQVILWPYCIYALYGIQSHFKYLFGAPTRTLYVYTDAGQSQLVGGTMTDLLREFVYVNRGEGRFYFEPRQLHFLPIRKNVMDTITVVLRDEQGQKLRFQETQEYRLHKGNVQNITEPTIVTLKFERRSARV